MIVDGLDLVTYEAQLIRFSRKCVDRIVQFTIGCGINEPVLRRPNVIGKFKI